MSTVKAFNKRTGTTYVYSSKNYYDREAHKVKAKRKLIGKIDKETGEMIPTGKVGRPRKKREVYEDTEASVDYKSLYERYLKDSEKKNMLIENLQSDVADLKKQIKQYKDSFRRINSAIQDVASMEKEGEEDG